MEILEIVDVNLLFLDGVFVLYTLWLKGGREFMKKVPNMQKFWNKMDIHLSRDD